jgi:tRNA uridine 5-carboxymethylaminomethyl modification enzyme
MHVGMTSETGGRVDEPAATTLSDSLHAAGLEIGRLKTGTPPRVDGNTIDRSVMSVQNGEHPPPFFSFSTEPHEVDQIPCWLTSTNSRTHEIIRGGLDRSPLYTGRIKGVGPRYCPSIEDKVVRFSERDHHQIFIEPEGVATSEVYVNGFPSSLPEDVQLAALRSISGMEKTEVNRFGYAVEYDFVFPQQLFPSLESKPVRGLYLAGQINGTSGYEEAAGQGLMAGVNAARSVIGAPPVVLQRNEAYIGVMIDDLVTKGTEDPYRLFTSRAEHRLLLRQDNADTRLADRAREMGLISDVDHRMRRDKAESVAQAVSALRRTKIAPEAVNSLLRSRETPPIATSDTAAHLLKRPEIILAELMPFLADRENEWSDEIGRLAETEIKYEGYLTRQQEAADRQSALERRTIPADIDYSHTDALSAEAKHKFSAVRPMTLGQASRIPGITPADVAVLAIVLEQRRRQRDGE